ncbi:uncharacterized protein AB9W97_002681 isoform 1-T1 [Spinachia spinachia]
MNPADSDHLKAAICSQGTRLNQQEDQLLASSQEDFKAGMTTQVNLLSNQIYQMLTHLTLAQSAPPAPAPADIPPAPAPHGQALRLASPEKFSAVQWRAASSRDPEESMQLGQARLVAEER